MISSIIESIGNRIQAIVDDKGVELPGASLFDSYGSDHYSSSEEDTEDDLESGRVDDRVELSPEDKAMMMFRFIRRRFPEPIPLCREMLYIDMIRSKEEANATDVALGFAFPQLDEDVELIDCYWMRIHHPYVEILEYNREELETHPIYDSVNADHLHFVCIQSKHVDQCVTLFWNKFVEMALIPNPIYDETIASTQPSTPSTFEVRPRQQQMT